jgi:hypothetical protein
VGEGERAVVVDGRTDSKPTHQTEAATLAHSW